MGSEERMVVIDFLLLIIIFLLGYIFLQNRKYRVLTKMHILLTKEMEKKNLMLYASTRDRC